MNEPEGAVLCIWDRIGDYHLARIKACEQILSCPVYSADLAGTDALYKWESTAGNHHVVLSAKPAEQPDVWTRFTGFRRLLKEKEIRTVAMPYGRTEYILFLLYARFCGIRTIVFCESWYPRTTWKDRLKGWLLSSIGQYFFVSGKHAFHHVTTRYKIRGERVYQGYSVVDNSHFRVEHSLENRKEILLCVARYSPEKNLALLIKAFLRSEMSRRFTLHIVGDGPLKHELNQLADPAKIRFVPWTTYTALPTLYHEARLFVLPSRFEPWGLVVNEAMAAGIPVLVSDVCGCLPDLIESGKNGEAFPYEDEEALADLLTKWSHYSNEQLQEMGNRSVEIIRSYSPETWARTIRTVVEKKK